MLNVQNFSYVIFDYFIFDQINSRTSVSTTVTAMTFLMKPAHLCEVKGFKSVCYELHLNVILCVFESLNRRQCYFLCTDTHSHIAPTVALC